MRRICPSVAAAQRWSDPLLHDPNHVPSEIQPLLPRGLYGPRIADCLTVSLEQENIPVGLLRLHAWNDDKLSEFTYKSSWLKHRRFFDVSAELRVTRSSQWRRAPKTGGRNVFGALADTQPSGFSLSVIQRARERRLLDVFRRPEGDTESTDSLCAVLDTCRLGALRIRPRAEQETDATAERFLLPRRSDLDAIGAAVAAFERGNEDLRQLLLLLYCATALGGSRPKCTWIQEDGHLAVAKFPSVLDAFPSNRIEVLMAHMAKTVGIDVVDVEQMHLINPAPLLAQRFDRTRDGARKHFLSARSLLLLEEGEPIDHLELLDAMRRGCSNFGDDALQLWRRLVFGHLIGDEGAGLRKAGFLYVADGHWRLAPASGMRPAIFRLATKDISGNADGSSSASLDTLMREAKAFGIALSDALVHLRLQVQVLSAWRTVASQSAARMSAQEVEQLEPMMNSPQLARAKRLVFAKT